jgi:ABC-type cobalamin transport system permease subunit
MPADIVQHARRWIKTLVRVAGLAVFLAGAGLVAYAGVQWLQTEQWHPFTIGSTLASWPATRNWIAHPQSWRGLHRLVVWAVRVPLYAIGLVFGAALLFITAS